MEQTVEKAVQLISKVYHHWEINVGLKTAYFAKIEALKFNLSSNVWNYNAQLCMVSTLYISKYVEYTVCS